MKWLGISGTWRTSDSKVEEDVRAAVRTIIAAGDGVLNGGATGVDFYATDEALKLSKDGARVKVVLPTTLPEYIGHLWAWAGGFNTGDPSVQRSDVEKLVSQLLELQDRNPSSIVEGPFVGALDLRQPDYDARDTIVAQMSDGLVAFQVNKSKGTQDTIDKTRALGKPVTVHSYTITRDKAYGKAAPKPLTP
jgi:hypothetical protein